MNYLMLTLGMIGLSEVGISAVWTKVRIANLRADLLRFRSEAVQRASDPDESAETQAEYLTVAQRITPFLANVDSLGVGSVFVIRRNTKLPQAVKSLEDVKESALMEKNPLFRRFAVRLAEYILTQTAGGRIYYAWHTLRRIARGFRSRSFAIAVTRDEKNDATTDSRTDSVSKQPPSPVDPVWFGGGLSWRAIKLAKRTENSSVYRDIRHALGQPC